MTETPQQERPGIDTDHLRDYERLRRSVTDRKIAGVAGGLGRHLNIDPTIVRVVLVVLCFFGGAGLVLYAAAWLVVPDEGTERGLIATNGSTRNVILLGIAALAALLVLGGSWHGFGLPWICFVVAIVVFALLAGRDRRTHERTASYARPADTRDSREPGDSFTEPAPPWTPPTDAGYPPPPPPRPDRGPLLFGPTLALVAVAMGVLGLVEATGHSVTVAAYPALALAVIGAMLLLGAWVGRAGGLILLGLAAAIALGGTSLVAGANLGNGHLRVDPTSATQLHDHYFLPAGRVHVDLTDVTDPANLDGRSIDIGSRAATIVVVVPHDVRAQVDAEVTGPGDIVTPSRNEDGFGTVLTQTVNPGVDSPLLHLRLHTFAGHIEVRTRW